MTMLTCDNNTKVMLLWYLTEGQNATLTTGRDWDCRQKERLQSLLVEVAMKQVGMGGA